MSTPNPRSCKLHGLEPYAPRRARRYKVPKRQIQLAHTPPLVPDDNQWWPEIQSAVTAGAPVVPVLESDFDVGLSSLSSLPRASTAPLKALSLHLSQLDTEILPEPPMDVRNYIAFLRLVRLSLVFGSAALIGLIVATMSSVRPDSDWLSQSVKPVAAITAQIRQAVNGLASQWQLAGARSVAQSGSAFRGDWLGAQAASPPTPPTNSEYSQR